MLLLSQLFLNLILLIYQLLLSLDILEHVFALRQNNIVWKHLGVFFIERAELWKARLCLRICVRSL